MSENTESKGQEQEQGQEQGQVKLFSTKEECEAAKPTGDGVAKNLRPFEVSKAGTAVGWVLARGYDHGLAMVARLEGYTVSLGNKSAPVTKEAVAAKLAEFTDDELAAMGLSRKKGGKR
jgi:hypothetical protein